MALVSHHFHETLYMCDVAWKHKQYTNKYSDEETFKVITSDHSLKGCASAFRARTLSRVVHCVGEVKGKTQWHENLSITLS